MPHCDCVYVGPLWWECAAEILSTTMKRGSASLGLQMELSAVKNTPRYIWKEKVTRLFFSIIAVERTINNARHCQTVV